VPNYIVVQLVIPSFVLFFESLKVFEIVEMMKGRGNRYYRKGK